jgi:hypothetical protein
MNFSYFRALASRCRASVRDCGGPFAQEEFRRLAVEFESRAYDLEHPAKRAEQAGAWPRWRDQPKGHQGDP